MTNPLIVTILFLLPTFLLLNEDISLERTSLRSIHRIGDRTSVRVKLQELGLHSEEAYENFRYKELILCSAFSFCVILMGIFRNYSIFTVAGLLLVVVTGTLWILEKNLARRVMRQRERIEAEFAPVVEMLTLSLSAGESPLSALHRVTRGGSGILIKHFSQVIEEVSEGKPFVEALDLCGKRLHSTSVRRLIDAIVIAIARGVPLVEVLQSHAQEAQSRQRNRIMGLAAKAEMSMMVPVVFLILPISILFALWPSLTNLNLYM
jgi:tight adherence protein C